MGLFDFLKPKKKGIDTAIFDSEQYQQEITALAQTWYFENGHNYEIVKENLAEEGLTDDQCEIIAENLRQVNARMVDEFKAEADAGRIAEIKITPNPEHKKGEVTEDQVNKYIGYGAYQMDRGDLDNALELFDKAIELDDKATLAYANKGTLYSKLGDDAKAVEFYNKAIKLDPDNKQIYANKAIACAAMGEHAEEKKCYAEILRIDSNDIEAAFALSQCHVADGEFAAALGLLNKVIAKAPNSEDLHGPKLSKIGILIELGFAEEANKLYLELVQRFPEDVAIHNVIPAIYYAKGRKDEATGFFDKRRQATNDAIYLRHKADFLYHRDREAAIDSYDAWLAINPDDAYAIERRLALYQATGKNVDIVSEVARLLEIDPDNLNALNYMAGQLIYEGEYEKALELAEKIYTLDKSNMESVSLMIQISEQLKSEPEIIELIEKLKRENAEESYNIEFRKGLYYKSAGKYGKAIAIFESQNRVHEFAWNYYQIAIIKNLQGDVLSSLKYLEEAFELDPSLKQDARQHYELENLWSNEPFIKLAKA